MAKETAEQKLLKLIEMGGSDQDASQAKATDSSAEVQQVLSAVQGVDGSFSIPPLASFLNNILKSVSSIGQFRFGLKQVNRLLIAATIVMFGFVGMALIKGMKTSSQQIKFDNPESVSFSKTKLLPGMADLSQYVSVISFRNIFHPYEKKVVPIEEVKPEVVRGAQILEKTESLRLVGISWFDSAESASAMIENTASGVTYFLRSGEKINGTTVEAIYADSIVLEFNGEKMEFKL